MVFGNSPAADGGKRRHCTLLTRTVSHGRLEQDKDAEERLPGGGGSYEGGPMLLACICGEAAGGMVPARRECGLCILPCLSGASG